RSLCLSSHSAYHTLSLHDALPILETTHWINLGVIVVFGGATLYFHNEVFIKWKPTVLYWLFAGILVGARWLLGRNIMQHLMGKQDRKSTRLNSSHVSQSYAVFCSR